MAIDEAEEIMRAAREAQKAKRAAPRRPRAKAQPKAPTATAQAAPPPPPRETDRSRRDAAEVRARGGAQVFGECGAVIYAKPRRVL